MPSDDELVRRGRELAAKARDRHKSPEALAEAFERSRQVNADIDAAHRRVDERKGKNGG